LSVAFVVSQAMPVLGKLMLLLPYQEIHRNSTQCLLTPLLADLWPA